MSGAESEQNSSRRLKRSHPTSLSEASVGKDNETKIADLLNGQGIGSREYFGQFLHLTRLEDRKTLKEWSESLGIPKSVLSRLETAKQSIPVRNELLAWGILLNLPQDEVDRLMVAAGYIPETGFEAQTAKVQHQVLMEAMREVLGRPDVSGGFIEMLQKLIKGKQPK